MFHVKREHVVERQLRALGISVPSPLLEILIRHTEWVVETSKTTNLTAIKQIDDALRLHLVDSLSALVEVEGAPEGPLLDIGTGGGYPGLPLALASSRRGLLLDSVAKKVTLVADFLTENGLTGTLGTRGIRAEQLAMEQPGEFAVVVARAVAPLPSLVELASPLLMKGGLLVALKGDPKTEEIDAGARVAAKTGMAETSVRRFVLPDSAEKRSVFAYKKKGRPSVRLPRAVGKAQNQPLA